VIDKVSFEVSGKPAGQGSKRHVGGGRMIEMSRTVGPWRDAIRAQCTLNVSEQFTGPVTVTIVFSLPRPAGHYGTGRNSHALRASAPGYPAGQRRDDVDKMARAVLDALTEGPDSRGNYHHGAFKDDSQVVDLLAMKRYASAPEHVGARITVEEVTE
jgi:crossover junction endodeoxyribonuclease RusA